MAAPDLAIAVQPVEGGKAMYLPLAPRTSGATEEVKIVLRLRITNNESSTVTVSGIQFTFPGSQVPAKDMQGVALVLDPDGDLKAADIDGALMPGQTAAWSNGVVKIGDTTESNVVYLTAPAPPKITAKVSCQGFSSAASVTFDLAPYTKPTPDGALLLPYGPADLREHEYLVTSAKHWANGGAAGGQIFAHDIGVSGYDPQAKTWSGLLPGGSKMNNEDYRIWGKPIRAVADGVVESWLDDEPTNTITADDDGKLQLPKPTPDPTSGNHFWIKHDDVFVIYTHLQEGTLPEALMVKGAPVKAGQKLGLTGNSGNSTNPHTHIECHRDAKNGPLRGMPFRNGWVVDPDTFQAPAGGPWAKLTSRGIPREKVAIWPESTWPTYLIPMAGIARGGDWASSFWISPDRASFETKAQELFNEKGRRLIHVSTYVENGQRRWIGIARGGDWANSFWVSDSRAIFETKAQQLFDDKGRRLVHVHTYPEGSGRRWVGIARGGTWASSFWVSDSRAAFETKAQQLFNDKGRRLVHVHTYPEGNARRWVGIARSGDWANSFWVSNSRAAFETKAQQLFDDKGRRLVHVETYKEGNQRRWIGIARAGDWANSFWVSADLDSFRRTAQDLFDEQGRRLMTVCVLA